MFTFNKGMYEGLLKFLAVLSSVTMMFISAQFSVAGFSFQSPDKIYIGWLLAVILIIVELIFNNSVSSAETIKDPQDARRMTILFVAGLVAYAYGIATNISGILHSGKLPDSIFDYIVPVALGLFLEIVPEPLMVWALLTPRRYPAYQSQTNQPRFNNQPKHNKNRHQGNGGSQNLNTAAFLDKIRAQRDQMEG